MSDEPSAPSNPPSNPNNRGNNRGGYRPNRRRYPPRANAQGNKPPVDPDLLASKAGGAPASEVRPAGPPPQGQQGQNRPNSGRRGGKDRSLPDRDRGPRRGNLPDQAPPASASDIQPPAQKPAQKPAQPSDPNRSQGGGERADRRRRRLPKPGGSNQPRGGPNADPRGRQQAQSNQNRGQRGPKPQDGQPRPPDGQERLQNGPARPQGGQARQQPGGQRGRGGAGQQRPRPGDNGRPAGQGRRYAVRGEAGKPQGVAQGEGARKPRKPNRAGPAGETAFDYVKPPPIKTNVGIKARSQEGQYALSWWAARWIAAMENLVDGRRLGRGRSYAKDGQVLSIEEKPGGVTALVQGSRLKPYRVAIEVIPLADFEWEKVFDVLASQALFAAQLLAGEMPRNIEEAFDSAGTSLFPARLGDLHTDCTCPDWANPCKHVAATHYILAERFDEDPFLLFRLRGRTSEQILAALRERRAGSSDEPLLEEPPLEEIQPVLPLSANPERFYRLGRTLDDFSLSFKEPAIEMAVLKRLGDPNFLGQESLLATLDPVYRAVRAAALEAALGEANGEEEDGNNGK